MKKQPKKEDPIRKLGEKYPDGKIPFEVMMKLAVKTKPPAEKKGKKKG